MTEPTGAAGRARQAAKRAVDSAVRLAAGTHAGKYLLRQVIESAMSETRAVSHNGVTFRFAAPNTLCAWRAATFASKEPETLEWIDGLPRGSMLWDVGANVGLYAVYAARTRGCRVYAFEPSVFNLELLARNVHLNGLTELICIVPLALSDTLAASHMRMTTTEWGGALSTFGRNIGWDGHPVRQVFEFKTIGLSMQDAIERLEIPAPDYIKMDVDGLEHFILKGGASVLTHVRGILIEVNDDFHEQADQVRELLTQAGLVLKEKRHSELIGASTSGFAQSFNQIWGRP
jgi:FkbM family methyltransferase